MANPISPLDLVLDRLGCSDPAKGALFSWDEVKDWPSEALDGLVASGLLQPAQPTTSIMCDGCEQNCIMPVNIYPAQDEKQGKAFITCDKRDDIGRVQVDFRRMAQWLATNGQIATAISGFLKIDQRGPTAIDSKQWRIGMFKGRKHISQLTLEADGKSLFLSLAGHNIPLVDVLAFEDCSLALDKVALIRLVDEPTSKCEIEKPEERKARLIARVKQERAKGTKAFLQVVAEEEGVSTSRLKQLIKVNATPKNKTEF